jgi:F420-dependent oxidoreductase-like protein
MEIAIMIEGQNGLNWPRWQKIASAVEQLGFVGLFRSDHITNNAAPDLDSLELWVSLTWLASHTRRIEFGSLVTPMSVRHPVLTARMAAAVDDLSGGRLTLGLGAGWQEREHQLFGFDLLPIKDRLDRFEEGLQVVTRLMRSDQPVTYQGKYYQLRGAALLPPPLRSGGPRILVGGTGERRTLPLAARFADEWNGIFLPPQGFTRLNSLLDHLIEAEGRKPGSVKRSLMTGVRFGRTQKILQEKLAVRKQPADELRKRGIIVGTGSEVADQLGELGEVGVQRIMLQWLELDDLDGLEALAKAVL